MIGGFEDRLLAVGEFLESDCRSSLIES